MHVREEKPEGTWSHTVWLEITLEMSPGKQRVNLKCLCLLKSDSSPCPLMRDVLIFIDLLFLLSSRQGATGSGKTLLPSHLFAPLVQVWVVWTCETNWFCPADIAGLSISAEHNPFVPAVPQPLARQGAAWQGDVGQSWSLSCRQQPRYRAGGTAVSVPTALHYSLQKETAWCPSLWNTCKMHTALMGAHGRNCMSCQHQSLLWTKPLGESRSHSKHFLCYLLSLFSLPTAPHYHQHLSHGNTNVPCLWLCPLIEMPSGVDALTAGALTSPWPLWEITSSDVIHLWTHRD